MPPARVNGTRYLQVARREHVLHDALLQRVHAASRRQVALPALDAVVLDGEGAQHLLHVERRHSAGSTGEERAVRHLNMTQRCVACFFRCAAIDP